MSGKIDEGNDGAADSAFDGLQCTKAGREGLNTLSNGRRKKGTATSLTGQYKVLSATATLLIPSGAYTLIVTAATCSYR